MWVHFMVHGSWFMVHGSWFIGGYDNFLESAFYWRSYADLANAADEIFAKLATSAHTPVRGRMAGPVLGVPE
jgi:hypothetical protein